MNCGRCQTPLEAGDLRCAICALAVPLRAALPSATAMTIVRCERCGAALTYSAEAQGSSCVFCGSLTRLEQPADPLEVASAFLPFRVAPETAHAALGAWLRRLGWFRPSDLATAARLENLRPLFWCAWIFDADALVSWAADSNAGSGRSAWAPHAGQERMNFRAVLVPATRGLSDRECRLLASGFDLSTAAGAPSGPAGAIVEHFDVQRAAARAIIAESVRATAIDTLTRGHVPGSRFRNVHAEILLHALTTHRVAMPTYVMAYRYKDRLYRAIVHGQDARHVFGDAPKSWAKIFLVVLAVVVGVALIVTIVVVVASN
jgi:hypothetical protein